MKIKVTEDDIKQGSRTSSISCPVALSIQRTLKLDRIKVLETEALIGGAIVQLPTIAQTFIYNYDHGFSVEPIEFDI